MLSCSSFGLPIHAQLLRLFVTPEHAYAIRNQILFVSTSPPQKQAAESGSLQQTACFCEASWPLCCTRTGNPSGRPNHSVVSCCYNRQGRKANRRNRDSYSNRVYSRTQTVRNTGTHDLPLYLTPVLQLYMSGSQKLQEVQGSKEIVCRRGAVS